MGTKKVWCVGVDIPRERWELRKMMFQDRAIAVSGSKNAWEEYKRLEKDHVLWRSENKRAKQITISYDLYRNKVLYGKTQIGNWSLFNSRNCPERLKV